MPLVRLEVDNFKSYRGKQTIGPFRSFNSVIGPNGSGKSNLMDAISFVLGVKSSHLRSSQLKDLIYRGRRLHSSHDEEDDANEGEEADDDVDMQDSQQVPSNGTAKRASVTAVYQDKDGVEHHFQRSVNSSGNSEYRLSGRAVSASTYNEKLKTFNILVKAKNFLVFQGDVEAVASQNPKDLSRLIDQISGSLEYKEQYEAARVALERAHENHIFISHKRRAMNSELKHFKEQKNEAERFRQTQRERDDHVVRQILWKLYHIEHRVRDLTSSINKTTKHLPVLREQAEQMNEAVEAARQNHGEVTQSILQQQKAMRKREKEGEKLQPDLDATDQKIKHSQRKIDSSEEIIRAVQADIAKYERAIDKLRMDHQAAKEASDRAAAEHARSTADRGLTLSEEDLQQYRRLREEANLSARQERQQLETLSLDIRAHEGKLQGAQDKLVAAQEKKEKLQSEADLLQAQKGELEERRSGFQNELETVRASVHAQQEKKESVHRKMDELNATLQQCLETLLEAGQMQRESERESRAREMVASLKQIYPGVLGRIVDLCKPTQRKYDIAIQTVLGKNAEAIVVETQKEAIECIEYLKRQRIGQATFIPLDTAQTKEVHERLRSIAPGARLAIDILEYSPALGRAIHYACGNALVCDTMEIARHICYDMRQQAKAVTLEGTVIHKSGLITGGRSSDVSGPRWQNDEVEGFKRQRDQCIAELRTLSKQQHELEREGGEKSRVMRIEAELATSMDDLKAVTTRLDGVNAEISTLTRQIAALEPHCSEIKRSLERLKSQTTTLQETVDAADGDQFQAFCRKIGVSNIREYESSQSRLLQQQSDARTTFERQMKRLDLAMQFERSQLDAARQRLTHNERVTVREGQRLQELLRAQEAQHNKLADIRTEIDRLRDELNDLKGQDESKRAALLEARSASQKAMSKLDSALKEISIANLDIEKQADSRLSLYRRCRLEEIDLPLVSGTLAKVPLEDSSFEMDLDDDPSQPSSVPDYGIEVDFDALTAQEKRNGSEEMEQELQNRIDAASSELERMSAPSDRAAERLDDTESRLADTDAELERLRRDEKKAHDEFHRLRKIRCDRYHSAFEHISAKVDEVYKDLTRSRAAPKGGNAYLDLQNDSEPYLEGVLYTAMPPTKSFRGIDQLSGGEKSVAALALLFAIHSYRPAPFFVLDEVDAALDAQNVARVAAYIRSRASAEFQFIVISLKAMLYEKSEALLGVMRNQDVNSSRTLTLDLEQYA